MSMALEYTLLVAEATLSKLIINQILIDLNFIYDEYEELDGGFRVDEFADSTGFSLAYYQDPILREGYDDPYLSRPFLRQASVTLRESRDIAWPDCAENMLKFFSALFERVNGDMLLTLNFDYIYLLRQNGHYSIKVGADIWQTFTGRAFLAQTPHSLLE